MQFYIFIFFFLFFQIVSVLTGKFADFIKECVIIDCRYPYEYEGGHIKVCWPCKSNVELSEVANWGHLAPWGLLFIQEHPRPCECVTDYL